MTETIRACTVCGHFYPAQPQELSEHIEKLLAERKSKHPKGKVKGLILPHAGYVYSGMTAAHGIALLKGQLFDTVAVISPSHREYFDGISVYPGDGYRTPLGTVPIDDKLRAALLAEYDKVQLSDHGHGEEHAIEVQLPFLQHMLPAFRLLPIVIGDQRREYCFRLGSALASILGRHRVLIVASTDLSHYHDVREASALDSVMIDDVERFDFGQLMTDLEEKRTEACGGGPTVAALVALSHLGVKTMEILDHSNSGDVTGDMQSVVGYLSAAAFA